MQTSDRLIVHYYCSEQELPMSDQCLTRHMWRKLEATGTCGKLFKLCEFPQHPNQIAQINICSKNCIRHTATQPEQRRRQWTHVAAASLAGACSAAGGAHLAGVHLHANTNG